MFKFLSKKVIFFEKSLRPLVYSKESTLIFFEKKSSPPVVGPINFDQFLKQTASKGRIKFY